MIGESSPTGTAVPGWAGFRREGIPVGDFLHTLRSHFLPVSSALLLGLTDKAPSCSEDSGLDGAVSVG